MKHDLKKLTEDFLNKKITVKEFERKYIDYFPKCPLTDQYLGPLEQLFFAVDDYTDIPFDPENNKHHWINEDQLRERAQKTLDELIKLGWK